MVSNQQLAVSNQQCDTRQTSRLGILLSTARYVAASS